MNSRILKKIVDTVYNAAVKGDFKSAYARLQKVAPDKHQKILTVFNAETFNRLGAENGSSVVANFARYSGVQQGIKQAGGMTRIAEDISDSMNRYISKSIESASKQVLEDLPETRLGWTKLALNEELGKTKEIFKKLTDKFSKCIKTKSEPVCKTVKTSRNIPDEFKPIFMNLEGKTGQQFTNTAYENMVGYMNLKGTAPKNIITKGDDGVFNITGGYDNLNNTISYSKGFYDRLTPAQQLNLIAHELKHCEQVTNMLRTEGIGVSGYAKAIAENNVRGAIKDSDISNIMFKQRYNKAVQQGKGEEFINKSIESMTKDLIPEIETNFAHVLKMPKIKANSPEGIKAGEDLKALKKYEGLNIFGFASKGYKNNPLETEAYAFGDGIKQIFNKYTK